MAKVGYAATRFTPPIHLEPNVDAFPPFPAQKHLQRSPDLTIKLLPIPRHVDGKRGPLPHLVAAADVR